MKAFSTPSRSDHEKKYTNWQIYTIVLMMGQFKAKFVEKVEDYIRMLPLFGTKWNKQAT